MKRVAILGCENSHANSFLSFIKNNEEFSDVEVVGVYSDETEAAEKLSKEYGVPVMADYHDAIGKIDGLVITARHGDNHLKYADPYIASGIPMFIDKPITATEADAITLAKRLKAGDIKITGGSILKQANFVEKLKAEAKAEVGGKTLSGLVRSPYQPQNAYGGFSFYAQHLVEIVLEIFGRFPISVSAKQNGKQLHVLFHYEEFDCVGLFCDNNYVYYACRMSEEGASGDIIDLDGASYKEFKEFYDLLEGKEQTITYEEFVSPVFVMNAILRALESGSEEPVGRLAE